ncbi:MAG: response regulator [Elusimicrobia bacterium]|nr:response regulator [Elusimicrobiota bacterium]
MKGRVLVVEDEQVLSGMIRYFLQGKGLEVQTALCGEEALKLVESFGADVLVLDLMLPDMHGFEVLEKIRNNPARKDIPVIVISTLKSKTTKEKARALGVRAYLVKPFQPEDLIVEVERVLPP